MCDVFFKCTRYILSNLKMIKVYMMSVKQNFRDKIKCKIWNIQKDKNNTVIISPDISPSKTVHLTELKVQANTNRIQANTNNMIIS